jgi:hypothetical protein
MIANKNAITTRAIVVINKRDDLAVGVEVDVEVGEDEEVGTGLDGELSGTFAGTDIVCGLLQGLVVPVKI